MSKTKVQFELVTRTTKSQVGRTNIINRVWGDGDESTATRVGYILRAFKGSFQTFALVNGTETYIDDFNTQSQAGHAARDAFLSALKPAEDAAEDAAEEASVEPEAPEADDEQEDETTMLSLEEAAAILCGTAKNPVQALKKRIARGKVETFSDGDVTLVVMP